MTWNRTGKSLKRLTFSLALLGLSLLSAPKSEAIPYTNPCPWNKDAVYNYYEGNFHDPGAQVGYKRVYGCNSTLAPTTWGTTATYYTLTCYPCSLN